MVKKETYIDFYINNCSSVEEFIEDIVKNTNEFRPSYSLKYKTPIEYKIQLDRLQIVDKPSIIFYWV